MSLDKEYSFLRQERKSLQSYKMNYKLDAKELKLYKEIIKTWSKLYEVYTELKNIANEKEMISEIDAVFKLYGVKPKDLKFKKLTEKETKLNTEYKKLKEKFLKY